MVGFPSLKKKEESTLYSLHLQAPTGMMLSMDEGAFDVGWDCGRISGMSPLTPGLCPVSAGTHFTGQVLVCLFLAKVAPSRQLKCPSYKPSLCCESGSACTS